MKAISFHRKAVSRLLILIYLLIGSGLGNSLLWCQESEAFSHLEYNLSGTCQTACLPEESAHEGAGRQEAETAFSGAGDCLDTKISFAHSRCQRTNKPSTTSLHTGLVIPRDFPFSTVSAPSLAGLNLTAQPPPHQAHAVLRTTVLLI